MGSIGGTGVNSLGITNFTRKELEDEIRTSREKFWGDMENAKWLVDTDVRDTMHDVGKILDYFEENNIKNILEPDPDYPQDIMWKFFGTNKWSGETKIYEIPGKASASSFIQELRRNGYSPNRDVVLPRHLYDALLNYSNFEDYMVKLAQTMTKIATKKYRDSRRKK